VIKQDQSITRLVVIGAGVTGLSAAHRLLELAEQRGRAIELTVLEAQDRPGGVVHTIARNGFVLEAGPDNFVTDKPWAVNLCQRLGIDGQLQSTNPDYRRAMVVRRGRLVPVPRGFLLMAPTRMGSLALSPLFSWTGKLRMAIEPLIRRRGGNDDESLASFVTRRLGREALDRLVQPLVGGIYGGDPQTLSLRATMARFLDMERDHGSVIRAMRKLRKKSGHEQSAARYSLFVTFRNGMRTLIDELAKRIGSQRLRLGTPVSSLQYQSAADVAWQVRLADGQVVPADGIILACPTYCAADMVEPLDPSLAQQLRGITYTCAAVIHLAYRRDQIAHPLDAFGFVVPYQERRSIMACSFSSIKYPGRAPHGHVLLRAFLGGALQRKVLDGSDNDLVAAAGRDLTELLGITGEPLFTASHRWPRAMAQYRVGHVDHIEAIKAKLASHPMLDIVGNGFEGVGIPDCIRQGEHAAEGMMSTVAIGPQRA